MVEFGVFVHFPFVLKRESGAELGTSLLLLSS